MTWEDELIRGCNDPATGKAVLSALKMLFQRDAKLMEADSSEPSITSCLGNYLKTEFPEWDVDCEYNRQGVIPKKLRINNIVKLVYPDIIVHRRQTDQNWLVIEVKKISNPESDEVDLQKLQCFVEQLGYRHALFLRLDIQRPQPSVSRLIWVHSNAASF